MPLVPLVLAPAILAVMTMPAPCDLLRKAEVAATLRWTVRTARESPYRLPQARGTICRFDAAEGTVLVTVPDHGSSFFNNNDLVDPFKNGMGRRLPGIGASATLFDNTAYVVKGGRSVSIALLPSEGAADERSLATLAKTVAQRMP